LMDISVRMKHWLILATAHFRKNILMQLLLCRQGPQRTTLVLSAEKVEFIAKGQVTGTHFFLRHHPITALMR
jgi:hypothetical protein